MPWSLKGALPGLGSLGGQVLQELEEQRHPAPKPWLDLLWGSEQHALSHVPAEGPGLGPRVSALGRCYLGINL